MSPFTDFEPWMTRAMRNRYNFPVICRPQKAASLARRPDQFCVCQARPADSRRAAVPGNTEDMANVSPEAAGGRPPAPATIGSGTPSPAVRRWRRRLADEREEGKVYRSWRPAEGEEREILLGIAEAEERHAAHWETLLGDEVGPARRGTCGSGCSRGWPAIRSVFVLALAQRAETRSPYDTDLDATRAMAADKRMHEEIVRGLAARGRARVSGTFRAAVFGANDGLVSNLALVLGVSGGGASTEPCCSPGSPGCWPGRCRWAPASTSRSARSASCSPRRRRTPTRTPYCPTWTSTPTSWRWSTGPGACPPTRPAGRPTQCCAATPRRLGDPGARGGDRHDVVGTGLGAALSSFAFFATGAAIPVLPFLFGLRGAPRWSSPPCWWGWRCC